MLENPFLKQAVTLFKQNMENYFQTLSLVQGQSEQMLRMMVEQGASMQAGGKKFAEEWLANFKKTQEEYQKSVLNQLNQLEKFATGKKEA